MVPDLIPFMTPSINWGSFLKGASDATGRSIVRGVDASPRELSDPAKFLAVLSAFQDGNEKPLDAIRNSASIQAALHYGFLVYADEETVFQIMERTELMVTSTSCLDGERICVVTGNLKQWVQATKECCAEHQPFNLRLLFDKVILLFDRFGLGELWHDTRRRTLPDKTFLLEQKSK